MGLPALLLPRSVKNEIPNILSASGLNIEEKENTGNISINNDISNTDLVCSTADEKSVELIFLIPPEKMMRPEMLVVVLRHTSPSWLKKSPLAVQIETILRENGAVDFPVL